MKTNCFLQTSAPTIFAAGDVTGRLMLVPQAIQDGFLAATNAVLENTMALQQQVAPIGSFTSAMAARQFNLESASNHMNIFN